MKWKQNTKICATRVLQVSEFVGGIEMFEMDTNLSVFLELLLSHRIFYFIEWFDRFMFCCIVYIVV